MNIDEELLKYSNIWVEGHFDPIEKLMWDSTFTLHELRESLMAALLYAKYDKWREVWDITEKVIGYQFTNDPDPVNNGNFPRYAEKSDGTQGWADFNGVFLLILYEEYHKYLPCQLMEKLGDAITGAAQYVAAKLTVPYVSNHPMLEAFLVMRTGELFELSGYIQSGRAIWDSIYYHFLNDGIREYNAPGYTMVQLYIMSYLIDRIEDKEVVKQAKELRDGIYWSVSNKYHAQMGQLIGPHSRCPRYEVWRYGPTLMQMVLYQASRGEVPLSYPAHEDKYNRDIPLQAVLLTYTQPDWPKDWMDIGFKFQGPKQYLERIEFLPDKFVRQTTTFMDDTLGIGSTNQADCNADLRPLIAHSQSSYGIGLFHLLVGSSSRVDRRNCIVVHNNRSCLVAVMGDNYLVSSSPSLSVKLQWVGVPGDYPQQINPPQWGSEFKVKWMGINNQIMMGSSPINAPIITTMSEDTYEVLIQSPLPKTPTAGGWNVVPAVLFTGAFYFGDSGQPLKPINMTINSKMISLSWESPDGVLFLEQPNLRGKYGCKQLIDNQSIPIISLQESMDQWTAMTMPPPAP